MLLFRSEEHVDRWLAEHRLAPGALFGVEQCWRLAQGWYGRRLDPAFRRFTVGEAQAVVDGVGLTGDFWRLAPA
jgi:hypothetical protein